MKNNHKYTTFSSTVPFLVSQSSVGLKKTWHKAFILPFFVANKKRDVVPNATVWDDVATMRVHRVGQWDYFVSLKPRYMPSYEPMTLLSVVACDESAERELTIVSSLSLG